MGFLYQAHALLWLDAIWVHSFYWAGRRITSTTSTICLHWSHDVFPWRFSLSWLTPKSNNAESRAFINTFRCFVLCWLDNLCHTVLKSFCLLMFAQLSIYHAKASSLWCSVDVGSFFPGNEFCLAFITGFMLPSCRLPCEALFLQVLIFFCLHFRYWISVTLYMALSV